MIAESRNRSFASIMPSHNVVAIKGAIITGPVPYHDMISRKDGGSDSRNIIDTTKRDLKQNAANSSVQEDLAT